MHTSEDYTQQETKMNNTHNDNILEYLNMQLIKQCHKPNNLDIIKYLLQQGADINAFFAEDDEYNEYGNFHYTPLISAIHIQDFTTVKYLVEHGAHVNMKCDVGTSPLNEAVNRRNMELIKYLIDNGAKVTKRAIDIALDKNNNTQIIDYLQSF